MPQFQRKVVVAVHSSPLAASANQTLRLTWRTGGGPSKANTHAASMAVPARMLHALTASGLCTSIRRLFMSTQPRAMASETTTSKSPISVGRAPEEEAG